MKFVKNAKQAKNLHVRKSHGLAKPTWSRHLSGVQEEVELYDMNLLGYNYRMGELQAAIGLKQLKKVDVMNDKRSRAYDYYRKRIWEEKLNDFIQVQEIPKNVTHSHHILPVFLKKGNRKELRQFLHKRNIGTSIHYSPIPSFSYYIDFTFSGSISINIMSYFSAKQTAVLRPTYPAPKIPIFTTKHFLTIIKEDSTSDIALDLPHGN